MARGSHKEHGNSVLGPEEHNLRDEEMYGTIYDNESGRHSKVGHTYTFRRNNQNLLRIDTGMQRKPINKNM